CFCWRWHCVSHLRFHSLTKGPERSPGPLEELDEELDVIETNRLNRGTHGAEQEHDGVEDEAEDEPEDYEHDVAAVEAGEDQRLQDDDVERERHRGLGHPHRRESCVRDDIRQEPEELHQVQESLRRDEQCDAPDEHPNREPGDRIGWPEPDGSVDVPVTGEPAKEARPNDVSIWC